MDATKKLSDVIQVSIEEKNIEQLNLFLSSTSDVVEAFNLKTLLYLYRLLKKDAQGPYPQGSGGDPTGRLRKAGSSSKTDHHIVRLAAARAHAQVAKVKTVLNSKRRLTIALINEET
ncbi:hypothetical protein J6590_072506 [Homalodisca vitripennis]|nr:hypothetical protein J6590_072506 [Homalodisca vitripennis]